MDIVGAGARQGADKLIRLAGNGGGLGAVEIEVYLGRNGGAKVVRGLEDNRFADDISGGSDRAHERDARGGGRGRHARIKEQRHSIYRVAGVVGNERTENDTAEGREGVRCIERRGDVGRDAGAVDEELHAGDGAVGIGRESGEDELRADADIDRYEGIDGGRTGRGRVGGGIIEEERRHGERAGRRDHGERGTGGGRAVAFIVGHCGGDRVGAGDGGRPDREIRRSGLRTDNQRRASGSVHDELHEGNCPVGIAGVGRENDGVVGGDTRGVGRRDERDEGGARRAGADRDGDWCRSALVPGSVGGDGKE